MTNTPAVSIVISTHNRYPLLKEAVAGVFAQTFENWELIVVDNASDDETGDWLNEQQDARVIKLRLEQQAKRAARNKGLAVVRGEYVLFLDPSHLLVEPALQAHLNALAKYPDAVASVAGYVEFDEGKMAKRVKLVRHRTPRNLGPDIMFGWITAASGQCLFRLKSVKAVNGWDERLDDAPLEDHALWLRLARLGPAVLLPNILFRCRRRRDQSPSPQLWKLMTKLRKRATKKLDGKDYETAQQLLQARDDFKLGMKHYKQTAPLKALGCCLKALRSAPGLLRSPLTRPMVLTPVLKCLWGAPIFLSWSRRLSKKFSFPIRHIVTNGAPSLKKVPMRPNGEAWKFFDRCNMLGLEHELRWYWVNTVAAKRWRQMAERYQWIFILGCNNSGTMLMKRILESHPAISGVPRGGRGATVALVLPRYTNVIRLWTERLELFRLTEADQDSDALRLTTIGSPPYISLPGRLFWRKRRPIWFVLAGFSPCFRTRVLSGWSETDMPWQKA